MNGSQLGVVNTAITEEEGVAFEGTWMLLVHWNNVPTLRDITEVYNKVAIAMLPLTTPQQEYTGGT